MIDEGRREGGATPAMDYTKPEQQHHHKQRLVLGLPASPSLLSAISTGAKDGAITHHALSQPSSPSPPSTGEHPQQQQSLQSLLLCAPAPATSPTRPTTIQEPIHFGTRH